MLNQLGIGNFKAFADVQHIPIRPLTLIYGANSSGKSSILHSLILARHAQETGEFNVHRTSIGGESVDLGGFRQFIHRRNVDSRMDWTAELNTAFFSDRLAGLLSSVKRITVSISVGIALDDHGRPSPDALPDIYSYEVFGDDRSLIRMSKRRDGRLKLDRLDQEHPIFREILKAIVETSTTTENIQPSDYEGLDAAIENVVPMIVASMGNFLPEGLAKTEAFTPGSQASLFPVSRGRRQEDLAAAVRFFIPRTLDELIKGFSEAVSTELMRIQYLGPLRSYPPRHLAFSQHHDPNWFAGGGYAWEVVRRDAHVRNKINSWLSSSNRLQTPYEIRLGPLYSWDTIKPYSDEYLNDLMLNIFEKLNQDRYRDALQDWLMVGDPADWMDEDIEDWKSFSSQILQSIFDASESSDNFGEFIKKSLVDAPTELILIDKRSNTIVSHRDIGIGVSQVLPVLVGAYASKSQIIAIEQPEIHLHPALQGDLADVFIQSALGDSKNRFLIETHSEHLLLRVMRRIRETSTGKLPVGEQPISPEDVMVLFVEPKGQRSIIHQMPLNERGELTKEWPGGFFEEDFEELF